MINWDGNNMNKISNVLEAIFIGIVTTIISSYLVENITHLALILLAVSIFSGIILFLFRRFPKIFGIKGSFAVTALIFNSQHQLLLISHPRQKRWIPPGKHLVGSWKPHEEILKAVKEETGYEVTFHSYHQPSAAQEIDRFSTEVPQPFYILEETQLPLEGHVYHYDLFYICKLITEDHSQPKGSHQKQWITLEDLKSLIKTKETYPDVLMVASRAYKEVFD